MTAANLPYPNDIRTGLVQAMRCGEYASCAHLPRESVLAEKLGISRTQLRDILASLEREGFITRLHGVGTIINHHVLNVPVRMDMEVEFLEMIRQSGFAPAITCVQVLRQGADNRIAEQLQIPVGAPVLRVDRVCTADGKPAIYCQDYVDAGLAKGSYKDEDLRLPIFYFLRQFCGVEAYLDLTQVHPAVADEGLSQTLAVPVGTPLLHMEETDYDPYGKPVLYSLQYFVDHVIHHTVLRKKL